MPLNTSNPAWRRVFFSPAAITFFKAALLTAMGLGLYANFLDNPPVYDDANYFDRPQKTLGFLSFSSFSTRWLAYASMDATTLFIEHPIPALRLGNALLHVSTALALWALLHTILSLFSVPPGNKKAHGLAPWLAALVFALQPAAVYAAGYLIQRTIIMATLFAVLMAWAVARGIISSHSWRWYLLSALFYFLACLSKEHAMTAIALPVLLLVLAWRSGHANVWPGWQAAARLYALPAILFIATACWVMLSQLGILATPYEPAAPAMLEMSGIQKGMEWPLSILTQTTLFFNYLYLWIVPDVTQMAIDPRVHYATSYFSWPFTLGLIVFVAIAALGIRLLLRGGRSGIVGLSILAPWCLFWIELSVVRIQDAFVIYRSYLWAPWLYMALALFLDNLRPRLLALLIPGLMVGLLFFSYDRLTTFTQPLFLWDESARLAEERGITFGIERIYHNRGLAYQNLGMSDLAMQDYDHVLHANPNYFWTYSNRGALHYDLGQYQAALADFEQAVSRVKAGKHYMGRAMTREKLGDMEGAIADYREACRLQHIAACKRIARIASSKLPPCA